MRSPLRGNIPGGIHFITGWLHVLYSLLFSVPIQLLYLNRRFALSQAEDILDCALHLQMRTAEGSLGISISYNNGQYQVRLHDATLLSGWLDNSFYSVVILLQHHTARRWNVMFSKMTFGEFVKKKRIDLRKTLRQFCAENN